MQYKYSKYENQIETHDDGRTTSIDLPTRFALVQTFKYEVRKRNSFDISQPHVQQIKIYPNTHTYNMHAATHRKQLLKDEWF